MGGLSRWRWVRIRKEWLPQWAAASEVAEAAPQPADVFMDRGTSITVDDKVERSTQSLSRCEAGTRQAMETVKCPSFSPRRDTVILSWCRTMLRKGVRRLRASRPESATQFSETGRHVKGS